MAGRSRPKRAKVRGNSTKAQSALGLADIVLETVRLWRKHHLGYDQTKYVVEQARRRLKLQPLETRRRTVDRLDKSEVERLIRHTYQSHNKYGLMIKTLFLSGARVDEFVHIKVENLHLDADPPQIYLSHCKKESSRYVPVLPTLAQELRTHLNGRRSGYLFETNRYDRYSVRTVQSLVKSEAREAGIDKRVYPHLLRHSNRDDSAGFRGSADRPGSKIPWTSATLDDADLRRDQHSGAWRKLSARHGRCGKAMSPVVLPFIVQLPKTGWKSQSDCLTGSRRYASQVLHVDEAGLGAGGPVPWARQQIGIRRPALYSSVAWLFSARHARGRFVGY